MKHMGTFNISKTPEEFAKSRLHFWNQLGNEIKIPKRTAACWSDLLGFSNQLESINWVLNKTNTEIPLSRLVQLSSEINSRAIIGEETVFINDGVIRTCHPEIYSADLNERHNFLWWIESCIVTHCNVTGLEQDYSLPGIRTVICEGDLVQYVLPNNENTEQKQVHQLASLQLNTALSKCYISENLGSKIGLKKGGCYIEDSILSTLIERYGCKYYGKDMLFLYGFPIIKPTSNYTKENNLNRIPNHEWSEAGIDAIEDRSSWIQLGEKLSVNIYGLKFKLFEIKAFSPSDEFSLLWYDTLRGDMHGYWVTGIQLLKDDKSPVLKDLFHDNLEDHPVLDQFLSDYKSYKEKASNSGTPFSGRPQMDVPNCEPKNDSMNVTLENGDIKTFIKTDSGLFIPHK